MFLESQLTASIDTCCRWSIFHYLCLKIRSHWQGNWSKRVEIPECEDAGLLKCHNKQEKREPAWSSLKRVHIRESALVLTNRSSHNYMVSIIHRRSRKAMTPTHHFVKCQKTNVPSRRSPAIINKNLRRKNDVKISLQVTTFSKLREKQMRCGSYYRTLIEELPCSVSSWTHQWKKELRIKPRKPWAKIRFHDFTPVIIGKGGAWSDLQISWLPFMHNEDDGSFQYNRIKLI